MPALHSAFLREASVPEELAEVCAQYQMPAMALLDRDGVYGAPRFHLAAQKLKIKAHIGAEITFSAELWRSRTPAALPRVSLLCASREGYQNLCRLITRTKLRAPKYPKPIPKRKRRYRGRRIVDLARKPLLLLPIWPSMPRAWFVLPAETRGRWHMRWPTGGIEAGRELLEQLIAIYGHENVYVELQRHYNRAQEVRNQAAIELARSLRLPLLATQGAQYAKREERQILDVFTCIRNHRTLDTAGRLLAAQQRAIHQTAGRDAAAVCRSA